MSRQIAQRYRTLVSEVRGCCQDLSSQAPAAQTACKRLGQACEVLQEWEEAVGEVSQLKREQALTPVLLKSHNRLDQARLALSAGEEQQAQRIWQLQLDLYRLLNDL